MEESGSGSMMATERARKKHAASAVGFLIILLATFAHQAYARDAWETKGSGQRLVTPCNSLDPSLIAPVPADRRHSGIASLEGEPIIALDKNQAARFLGLHNGDKNISALGRIKSAIQKLREQKRLEIEERIGSWAMSDQERLDRLETLSASSSINGLKPYLVRAIAKNDFGTGFFVAQCGDSLDISHGSLGRGPAPPTIRFPLIIFLDRQPKSVRATWAIAE
jgi:hypothetical protein